MKSILIVAEQFTLGGLETHIRGEIKQLSEQGVLVHLAVGNAFDSKFLPKCVVSVVSGIAMEPSVSAEELLTAIDKLRVIIREHSIDAIHVHPFTSIIPAVAAAELEGIPYAITFHGPSSLSSYGPMYDFLLKEVILSSASLIFSVSPEVSRLLSVYSDPNAIVEIPNSVDFEGAELKILGFEDGNSKWLVVSRLDEFKIPGILDFCIKARKSGISRVLIVGDGPAKSTLAELLEINGLLNFVALAGARTDIFELMRQSNGVAGMGRVVLEAIAARRPVVLVGYDGVKGVVDTTFLRIISEANFSGRGLRVIDAEEFSEQLRVKLKSETLYENLEFSKHKFNEINAWRTFKEKLSATSPIKPTIIADFYHALVVSQLKESVPYLQSSSAMEILVRVVYDKKNHNSKLLSSLFYQGQSQAELQNQAALAEREFQLVSLKQGVVDRDSQLVSLKQEVVDRDSQLANFNQVVSARDKQIAILEHEINRQSEQINSDKFYKEDKEIYIAMLKAQLEKLNSRMDQKMLRYLSLLKRFPYYAKRSVEVIKARGFLGFVNVVALQIRNQSSINDRPTIDSSNQNLPASLTLDVSERLPSKNLWRPLLGDDLIIVTGVPFDDVGGGQRAAQLARCALKTGRRVIFLYIYKKFDFELNRHVESEVVVPGLIHKFIGATSPAEILKFVSPNATLLLEFPHNEALPYLQLFKQRGLRTVFELIDDWESSLGGDWFNLQIYHQFVHEAQFVVGTAKVLVKKLQAMGRDDAVYLPNAANEYIFDKYKNYDRPLDLPGESKKIALYFGSLYGDWFGWDYIVSAAEGNSDVDFVLIGDRPAEHCIPSLPSNVIFLGAKKIDELPAYLSYSDVGLLPFSPGKISDAVSPIKIFEYLFSSVPVVATNLPEIIDYPGIFIANSPSEFSRLCGEVCGKRLDNDSFIFQNSWFSRLENLTSMGKSVNFEGLTSAVILIHNNKSIIGRCLDSLLLHCAVYLKEVIVVDNASVDGGADFVEKEFPSVKVIRNTLNGCSSGRNLGAQFATGKFLAFFDSDQWFTSSSCFQEALSILNRDANVGAVGWGAGWFGVGRDDLGGVIADYCENRAMNEMALRDGYRSDVGYLATCGFFMPKVVFDSTEGFDVAYDPTCFEDTDISFQIKKLGLDICYRDLSGIRHQPHQTTKASSGSDAYKKLFKRNADYFRKKWAAYPNFFVDYVG